jgi:hypothetical protein
MLLLQSFRFVLFAEQSSYWESAELAVSVAEYPGLFSSTFFPWLEQSSSEELVLFVPPGIQKQQYYYVSNHTLLYRISMSPAQAAERWCSIRGGGRGPCRQTVDRGLFYPLHHDAVPVVSFAIFF